MPSELFRLFQAETNHFGWLQKHQAYNIKNPKVLLLNAPIEFHSEG